MNPEINSMEPLSKVIRTLLGRGYAEDFNRGHAKALIQINPDQFVIDKTFRFEGMTDPEDEAVLYAISSVKYNIKELLVNGYGIYADETVNKIVEKLKFPNAKQ